MKLYAPLYTLLRIFREKPPWLSTSKQREEISALQQTLQPEDFARHKNAPKSIPYLARARSMIIENGPGYDTDKDTLTAPKDKGKLKMQTKNVRGVIAKKKKQQREQAMAQKIYNQKGGTKSKYNWG